MTVTFWDKGKVVDGWGENLKYSLVVNKTVQVFSVKHKMGKCPLCGGRTKVLEETYIGHNQAKEINGIPVIQVAKTKGKLVQLVMSHTDPDYENNFEIVKLWLQREKYYIKDGCDVDEEEAVK